MVGPATGGAGDIEGLLNGGATYMVVVLTWRDC